VICDEGRMKEEEEEMWKRRKLLNAKLSVFTNFYA
jgi:hypothetical protein